MVVTAEEIPPALGEFGSLNLQSIIIQTAWRMGIPIQAKAPRMKGEKEIESWISIMLSSPNV